MNDNKQIKLIWDLMDEKEKFIFATSLYKNEKDSLEIIKEKDRELYAGILAFVFLAEKNEKTKEISYNEKIEIVCEELSRFKNQLEQYNIPKRTIEKLLVKHYSYLIENQNTLGELK